MKSVLCGGTQPAGSVGAGGSEHAVTPGLPCVRTGWRAASTAAGFVEVWSTIRLLITRGCVSKTSPLFAYEDDVGTGTPGPKNPAGAPSASRNFGFVSRGNTWSADANRSRPGKRLLQDPS